MSLEKEIENNLRISGHLKNLISGTAEVDDIDPEDAIDTCLQIEEVLYSLPTMDVKEFASDLIRRGYEEFVPIEILEEQGLLTD